MRERCASGGVAGKEEQEEREVGKGGGGGGEREGKRGENMGSIGGDIVHGWLNYITADVNEPLS